MPKATRVETRGTPGAARIVLIEDNAGDVYLLEKALKHRKIYYQLVRYEDGEQAVQGLANDGTIVPDLILLDLNLPGPEGFDVLRSIRNRPSLVGVPVGIFTSSDAAKDRHRVSLMGAERYIHKPPMLDEFIDQVGRAVEEMLEDGKRQRKK
jgi:chemotaxis family two-component system response regulator Rcp1